MYCALIVKKTSRIYSNQYEESFLNNRYEANLHRVLLFYLLIDYFSLFPSFWLQYSRTIFYTYLHKNMP